MALFRTLPRRALLPGSVLALLRESLPCLTHLFLSLTLSPLLDGALALTARIEAICARLSVAP